MRISNGLMMRILVIICSLLLVQCTQKSVDVRPETNSIVFISSAKKMKRIEGGTYEPFFGKDADRKTEVKSFEMDETAVTNQEFLEFLKRNPQWTKSKVLKLYADSTYLKNWESDFEFPKNVKPDAPVTNVSWFAAKAYAKSVGKRLPTLDEWEFAAVADGKKANASKDPEFTNYILKTYQNKGNQMKSVKQTSPNFYGMYDMYGVIWEWTDDFNSVMMTGESRKDKTTNETLFCAGAAVTTDDLRNYAAFMRFAMRGSLHAKDALNNLGFRCAKDIQ